MKAFLSLIVLFVIINISSETFLKRFYFNSILYEDSSSPRYNIMYIMTEDSEWKNLSKLIEKSNFTQKELFCTVGNGAWLAYPEVDFQHGNMMYFTILIGEECISAMNVESVQPIGIPNKKLGSAIITFTSPYFASEAKVLQNGSTSGDIQSLFHYGDKNWTIEGSSGDGSLKLCLVRGFQYPDSFCAISDIESQVGITGSLTIKEGCDNSSTVYMLQTCYVDGVNQVTVEMDLSIKKVKSICKSSMDKTEKNLLNKFTYIMQLWNSRIRSHLFTGMPKLEPEAESEVAKTYMFNKIISLFETTCPTLTPGYLKILSDIFYIHLRDIWIEKPENKKIYGDRWQDIENYLISCVGKTRGTDIQNDGVVEEEDNMVKKRRKRQVDPEYFGGSSCKPDAEGANQGLLSDMMGGEILEVDEVIEQVWLILNFVGPYCSHVNGYIDNFWTYFGSLLNKVYLTPLQEQWHSPGKWAEFYPSIFNGYSISSEKLKILRCIEGVMDGSQYFEPIGRPQIFYKNINSSSNSSRIVKGSAPSDSTSGDDKSPILHDEKNSTPTNEDENSTSTNDTTADESPTSDEATPDEKTPDESSTPDEGTKNETVIKKGRRMGNRKSKKPTTGSAKLKLSFF